MKYDKEHDMQDVNSNESDTHDVYFLEMYTIKIIVTKNITI